MSAVVKRGLRIVKSGERTARALDCAYCDRDALTMSRSGLIVIKAAHGEDAHPAAITIQHLLRWAMPHLDGHTLKDLENLISEARKNKLR